MLASMAVFLGHPESDYATGTTFFVDGRADLDLRSNKTPGFECAVEIG